MSAFDGGTSEKMRSNERVLVDITSASASASASAAASTSAKEGNERQAVTKLMAGSKANETEGGDGGHNNAARSWCTESDETPGSGASEEVENENPLLMSDISRMMETMHSKNLMLKKLVRMQQTRLEVLKTENEELRRDGKRKDARFRNAEVTIEYLRTEVEEQRHILERKTIKKVMIEEQSDAGHKRSNKQRDGGAKDDSGDAVGGSVNTNSLRRTSTNSGRKRCLPLSARWAVERVTRKLNGMKRNPKGVALCVCVCTLGGAMLLRGVLQLMNKNSECSDC